MKIGVSVPAYANIESLRQCLESVERHLPSALDSTVVVDDTGDGRVASALRQEFPDVRWIAHPVNLGFGASATEAVVSNGADVVILLNDDVQLLNNPAPTLQRAFAATDLFAITFRSLGETGGFREGAKRLVWRFGYPRVLHNARDQLPEKQGIHASSYAVGGHAAFDRRKFAALGGFDPLYEPFYWEDVDLAARARRCGWVCRYAPDCIVLHAGSSAIRTTNDRNRIREITERNRLLFAWRHTCGFRSVLLMLALHLRHLVARLSRDRVFIRAVRGAYARRSESQRRPVSLSASHGVIIDK